MSSLTWSPWNEVSPTVPPEVVKVSSPTYGRYLEEFHPGQVFTHPRGITLHAALAQDFATTFMESCPLYLNEEYPKLLGFEKQPVSPLMVLATALSLGVQNESEKAIAHLGYYDVCFPRVTYVGDTLRAMTRVIDKKVKAPGEPGIVHVQTIAMNQHSEVVVRYERKIMIPSNPVQEDRSAPVVLGVQPEFHWIDHPIIKLPENLAALSDSKMKSALAHWTSENTTFENFEVGQIIAHFNGRTVTDEHVNWTYKLGNTHPLHFDTVYTHSLPAPMGGAPVVYGGLVFSWITGLASRDTTENLIYDLGYTQGYHTQPTRTGDTLYAITRVLKKEDSHHPGVGILTLQLIGLKNLNPADAIKRYGSQLFLKENDKKKMGLEKIVEKNFEIERRVMIRKRSVI